jgi:hypothetical protein
VRIVEHVDAEQRARAEHNLAARRGAAGQRRLRADRQHMCSRAHNCHHLVEIAWDRDARRVPAGHMCCVLEKRGDHIRVADYH